MFHLRIFSIDIHKKSKSNHYLLLYLSVKYICLVHKLKFLLWSCPKFWALFMTDLQPMYLELFYLELYVLVLFGDCGSLYFDKKNFQNLILMFSFYPKNGRPGSRKTSITKAWLFVESCPTPHWVTFLTFYRLVYDIPCHLNGLILA